jgi:hypothetical protein
MQTIISNSGLTIVLAFHDSFSHFRSLRFVGRVNNHPTVRQDVEINSGGSSDASANNEILLPLCTRSSTCEDISANDPIVDPRQPRLRLSE